MPRQDIVIIDIDMVVADNRQRIYDSTNNINKINYEKFNLPERVIKDKIIGGAVESTQKIRKYYKIIYLSSRDIQLKQTTMEWLVKNNLWREKDELILVGSNYDKLLIIKKYLNRIFLYIDDFKYDYQSKQPKLSDHILPTLKEMRVPLIIFNNWQDIIKKFKL